MSGKYIVVFKKQVTQDQVDQYIAEVNNNGGKVTQRFDGSVLLGFAAHIPDEHLLSLKSLEGIVDYIEPDQPVTTQ